MPGTNDDPNDEYLSRWGNIIANADIKEVPINFLKEVSIKLLDGSYVNFDIVELLKSGIPVKELEAKVQNFVEAYDEEIDTLDFHINVEAVAKTVDTKTKGLLG